MASGIDVANVAIAEYEEMGGRKLDYGENKYNVWFWGKPVSSTAYPWCAAFVTYCLNKAGVSPSSYPRSASCYPGGYGDFYPSDRMHPKGDGYTPQIGDLMLRMNRHIGIVIQTDGGSFITIEGNHGNAVSRVRHSFGDDSYTHFLSPDYGESNNTDYEASWVEQEVPNIGAALGYKSYMAYQTITYKGIPAYEISHSPNAVTLPGGLRATAGKFIHIAMGSYYGADGTYVKIKFDDGKVIYCIKTDEKKDSETDPKHQYHMRGDRSVLEFVIDGNVIKSNDDFTAALNAQGINRSARITNIWTAHDEPSTPDKDSTGSTTTVKRTNFQYSDEYGFLHPSLFDQEPLTNPHDEIGVLANGEDITRYVGDIEWTNTIEELSTLFTFSVPKPNGTKYISTYTPNVGDIVRFFYGENERFRGVIITCDDSSKTVSKYTAADAGWYLNKHMDTYQFNTERADYCIKYILDRLSIPTVYTEPMSTIIDSIYIDKPISNIFKDILDKCPKRYNFDFVPKGIRIYSLGDPLISPQFRVSSNTKLNDSLKYKFDVEHKTSIENLITAYKAVSDTDVLRREKNLYAISKYGFIQTVIKVSSGEDPAEAIRKKRLQTEQVPKETYSFSIVEQPGSYTRAGDCFGGEDNTVYLVTSTKHSIKNGVHYNKLEVERYVNNEQFN